MKKKWRWRSESELEIIRKAYSFEDTRDGKEKLKIQNCGTWTPEHTASLQNLRSNRTYSLARANYMKTTLWKGKSLAQEVRQKSDISERRSKGWRGLRPFNPYFVCNTSNCDTVRPVRGHLTPKINIVFFSRNLMLNIFLFNNFLQKSCIFRENRKKLFWGAFDNFLGKEVVLLRKLT